MVLAKIVTDCHGRDLWRVADSKGVCRLIGYIVSFFIDSKKNKHYKTKVRNNAFLQKSGRTLEA
jgi:hypothetical protein